VTPLPLQAFWPLHALFALLQALSPLQALVPVQCTGAACATLTKVLAAKTEAAVTSRRRLIMERSSLGASMGAQSDASRTSHSRANHRWATTRTRPNKHSVKIIL
jgi:hypothetical protein